MVNLGSSSLKISFALPFSFLQNSTDVLSLTSLVYESSSDTWSQKKKKKLCVTFEHHFAIQFTVPHIYLLFNEKLQHFKSQNHWQVIHANVWFDSLTSLTSFSDELPDSRYSLASKNSDRDSGIDPRLSLDICCRRGRDPSLLSW